MLLVDKVSLFVDIEDGHYLCEMKDEIMKTFHQIVMVDDVLRWLECRNVDVNEEVMKFHESAITKNDEEWRSLYRHIGYSLHGYWEVFYWEANNENASEYKHKEHK